MLDIPKLKIELDGPGHPDTGPYSSNNTLAADELNAVNRPDRVSIDLILKFLLLDNVHSTDGADTQDRSIWQRMKEIVALTTVPSGALPNPWSSTVVGNVTEIRQIKTHQLLEFFTLSAQGQLPVDLTDSNFKSYVAGAQAAGCMSPSQETALLALANNLQSRAVELGLGFIFVGHIEAARIL